MSWSSLKKKKGIFCTIYFFRRKLGFISIYCVSNTLSEYTYFYISKNITSYAVVDCLLKLSNAFSVSLSYCYTFKWDRHFYLYLNGHQLIMFLVLIRNHQCSIKNRIIKLHIRLILTSFYMKTGKPELIRVLTIFTFRLYLQNHDHKNLFF